MAKKGAESLVEFARTPVLGWQRTVTYDQGRKRIKHVVEHTSFELRAWEVAALVGVGAAFYWIFLDKQPSSGTQGGLSTNPAAWFFGGPIGAWVWGSATGH